MAELTRWEPFRDLMTLREAMNRLFEESFVRPTSFFAPLAEGTLAVDMYETPDEVVVKAAVPGIKPQDLNISVTGDVLTIKGETKQEEKLDKANYIYQERRYGTFARTITLPTSVNADKAEATFEHGVLTLKLPKVEEVKPKVITVKAK
jgi:HSP20 family protein